MEKTINFIEEQAKRSEKRAIHCIYGWKIQFCKCVNFPQINQ